MTGRQPTPRLQVLDAVRAAIGLCPLVALTLASAHADDIETCGSPLAVDATNRGHWIATLAGDRDLGIPALSTPYLRQEWVRLCLAQTQLWPGSCDLRAVPPFDAAWAPEDPLMGAPRIRLYTRVDPSDPSRCTNARPRWSVRYQEEPEGGCAGFLIVEIDPHTGERPPARAGMVCSGRPFDGRLATAEGAVGAGAVWVQRAREEHASVASFARHLIEMLGLGAPLDLLDAITAAQADEVRHAALCLERAAELGSAVTLGPLHVRQVPQRSTPFEIARAVASEGCVDETLAAMQLADALALAVDPRERAILAEIVRDETRHACLAWRTLRWLWPQLTARERRRIVTEMHRALPADAYVDLGPCVAALGAHSETVRTLRT